MRSIVAMLLLTGGVLLVARGMGILLDAESEQQKLHGEWKSPEPSVVPALVKGSASGLVARMEFSRLQREVFILDGVVPSNLKRGPVWLRESARLGSGGNTVIAGHRDTHFRFLKDVVVGDRFSVDRGNDHQVFRVSGIRIVRPDERGLLAPAKRDVITLVTCYPFDGVGRAQKRMIVTAEMVSGLLASPNIQ